MPDTANEVFFHFDLIQDLQEKETFAPKKSIFYLFLVLGLKFWGRVLNFLHICKCQNF